jgi:hypothetical protein
MLSHTRVRTLLRMEGLKAPGSGVMSRIESLSSTISTIRSSRVGAGSGVTGGDCLSTGMNVVGSETTSEPRPRLVESFLDS